VRFIERGLFSAESKDTCRDRCNFVHLDCRASVYDYLYESFDRHHRRNVFSDVRLQQLRSGKDANVTELGDHIPATVDVHGGLLLKNCLQTKN